MILAKSGGQGQFLKVNRQGHFPCQPGAVLGTFSTVASPSVVYGLLSSKLLGVIL